jgi:hypothetical protein
VAILISNKIKFTEKVGMYDCNGKVERCATEIFFWTRRSTNYVPLQVTIFCGLAEEIAAVFRRNKRKIYISQ